MLQPAGGDGFLLISWAPSRHKKGAFPCQDDKSPFHSFTHPPAISASWCTSIVHAQLCPDLSCPFMGAVTLLSLLSPTGAPGAPQWPLKGEWLFLANGPCSKGLFAVAAWVSGTAESPTSVQTPGPRPMPTARIHSCTCRETIKLNLCSCTVCKVHPFFCACGGWVWVVFSLNYEQGEKMCLFPEQQGRKKPGTSRKWAKQNKIIMVVAKLWPWIKRSCIKSHSHLW